MKTRTLLLLVFASVGLVNPALSAESLKTLVNPEHLANTTQFGYSQATIVAADARLIHIAGQIGTSDDAPNDFNSQVDRAFANLLAVLDAAGGRVQDVVKITLLIKDHDEDKLRYVIKKRREVFGDSPPASTLIPVPVLALDAFEFEIDAVVVARP